MPPESLPLDLRENATVVQESTDPGSALIHVIRPGVGRGRGRHLYEADMLRENAGKFIGWPMYIDHLSPEAKKAMGGLPRSLKDTGGVIQEAWWDPNVPADDDKDWGQGAVVAKVKPLGFAKTLIEEAPEIVGASIAATATGVRPVDRNGERVWLVEGISDKGSVDWVTEAGAGGRVVSLVEAAYHSEEEQQMHTLETLTDDQIREHLAEHRQALLEELGAEAREQGHEGGGSNPPGGDMPKEITAEALQEALQELGIIEQLSEAINVVVEQRVGQALDEGLGERLEEALRDKLTSEVKPLIEQVVEEERAAIHEEAHSRATRAVSLRDMRDEAHKLVQESRLPESWKAEARAKFDLTENGPTRDLDVVDEVDDQTGEVTKTARQVLNEAVEAEIGRQHDLLAAVRPTRVRGQGPTSGNENNNGGGGNGDEPARHEGTLYGAVLQEAGIDPATAYEER